MRCVLRSEWKSGPQEDRNVWLGFVPRQTSPFPECRFPDNAQSA